MNRQLICVYMDFCASLESNICMANLAHCHLSLFQINLGPIFLPVKTRAMMASQAVHQVLHKVKQ